MNRIMKLSTTFLVHGIAGSSMAKQLLPGQVTTLEHRKGRHLYCTAGRLWVTLEHEPDDIILEANQDLEIDENGRVVIGALGPSAFKVA